MKAILILVEALKNRESIYSLSDSELTDAIKEAEEMQGKAQILILELKAKLILELKAKHKQKIKELKLKFIEDVSSLKDIS